MIKVFFAPLFVLFAILTQSQNAVAAISITSGPSASSITTNSAKITWTLSTTGTGQVQYGKTTSYGLVSQPETSTAKYKTHIQTLSGLDQGTLYNYRVVSKNSRGEVVYSQNKTFTTLNVPPTITSGPSVSQITPNSAMISWSVSEPSTGQVHFGETTAYGGTSTRESSFNYSSHLQQISGLKENTLYHYKVVSIDPSGAQVSSLDKSFATSNAPPVIISGPSAGQITSSSAVISWSASEATNAQVEFGKTTAYGGTSRFEPSFKFSSHTQELNGLEQNTLYHYRVYVIDQNGAKTYSSDKTFTTLVGSTTTTLAPTTSTTTTLPPATTTTLAPTTTSLPPSSETAPITVRVQANIETAGVLITLPASSPSSVSARVFYRKSGDSGYQEGHPFTRYDANNMATSLFELNPDANYELRVDYKNSSGVVTSKSATFRTQTDSLSFPAASRIINVSSMSELQSAVNSASAGYHIVMAAGTYSGKLLISGKVGTASSPIVIRGANAFDQFNPGSTSRAVIDGNLNGKAIDIVNSAYIIIHNIEIRNGGGPTNTGSKPYNFGFGVYINSSSRITIQNSYIHDNGQYNIHSTGSSATSAIGGVLNLGFHRIQNNFITDNTTPVNCPVNQWDGCSGITYEGISFGTGSGGNNIIRKNRIMNHIDSITACAGSSNDAEALSESEPHVLKQTSSTSGKHLYHNTDIYDNEILGSHDDEIEADGVCVNLKVFNNNLGRSSNPAHHALTTATMAPGPTYFVKNVIKGYAKSALKMNTGGSGSSRNAYLYHNTIIKPMNSGGILNLWYGGSGSAAVKNIQFKNNIFYAPNGSRCTDINEANVGGAPGTTLNYNLWYTPTTSSSLFEWWNGSSVQSASSISGFRSISNQEANGIFAPPALNSNYSLQSSSPAIDKAVRIPGINNIFRGSAPDIGAFEY